jgi:hypothetical protein
LDTQVREQAQQALDHYQRAQDRLRQGDYRGYGQELERMEQVLRETVETETAETAGIEPDAGS